MSARTQTHLRSLTGLRFAAAFGIVFYHFFALSHLVDAPGWVAGIALNLHVGVGLFFVLSGFIMAYTYLDGLTSGRVSRREFWIARLARIYPVYAVSIVACVPFRFGHLSADEGSLRATEQTLANFGLVMAMAQSWTPIHAAGLNPPSWSLSTEAFFYAVFPLVAALVVRVRRARSLLVLMAAVWSVSLGGATAYLAFDPDRVGVINAHRNQALWLGNSEVVWGLLFAHHPLARLPDFVLGVIAGTLFIRRPASARGSGVAAVAAIVGMLGLLGTLGTELPSLYANALLLPLFAALVYALGRGGGTLGRCLSQPLVVLLGEASYAIYILQDPAWRIGIALVRRVTGSTALTETWGYFVAFALVLIGLSVLSLYVVERPGRRRWLGHQPEFPVRAPSRVAAT